MNYIVPELYNKTAAQQTEAKKPGWLSAAIGPALLGLGAVANKNLAPAKAMFGPMLAQRARKFGVGLKVTRPQLDTLKNYFWDFETNKSVLSQAIGRMRNVIPKAFGYNRKDDYGMLDSMLGLLTNKKFRLTPNNRHKGPVLDFLGHGPNKGRIIGRGAATADSYNAFGSASKLDEAKVFPGIPESHGLKDLRKEYIAGGNSMDTSSVGAFLKQRFGGMPILKDQYGARSEGVITPSNVNLEDVLSYFTNGKGTMRKYMAQRFNPIARSSRSQDIMNLLSEVTNPLTYAKNLATPGRWKDSVKNILNFRKPYQGLGDKEFRVSIIDGKVVPYGVMQKRNGGGYYGSTLHWSDDHKAVHDYVAQSMQQLAPKYRKGLLGADVAIGTNGKPFIIEANPAIAGDITNVSGALTDPRVLNDIHAGVAGKLPYKIKRQVALTMAPGLAVTGNDVYQRMQD